ncbi:FIP1[V]-like protein isoform X2 [Euphorbia lathyris]|uniref:FIP1[V]-like protein isoform X2 n=1 Tax=Euphorbia lathyris TaxID=212925 RepID=UPI003313DB62
MEDDDEFGTIYTDAFKPSSSSLSSLPLPQKPSTADSSQRPIDLNLCNDDDDDTSYGPSVRSPAFTSDQSLVNSVHNSISTENDLAAGVSRVLGATDAKLQNTAKNIGDVANFQSQKEDKDLKFDIEEGQTVTIEDSGPMIPGLTLEADDSKKNEIDLSGSRGGREEDDDWEEDSDSEDDLRIVLNDTNHGPLGMERGMMADRDDDEDDEDEDPLVIVANGDPGPPMEEPDWVVGEDPAPAAGAEGERKESGEAAVKGNAVAAPKLVYSNHVYHHPFHSQFKYVRQGAAPIPGATAVGPGVVPGQVRPPINMALSAGRGRGDWRPPGMKNTPAMQKGYHPVYGMPAWGNNNSGRGFGGGLEFTLPSHKTIFDVDIDNFEEKPWKYPGVDLSDFFNFGLHEESWKDYCKQLEQHRLETTMQSKIRVYESGRQEQDYDPDLPPELAAATGLHDITADNSNLAKSDVGQSDLTKGAARLRPPLPTGRAIQVEGGYGERLPSIDTRPPRVRDSDAIIEIVLQDSVDDDSSTGNGGLDGPKYDPPRDDFRGSCVPEDDTPQIETEYYDFPQGYDGQKLGGRAPYIDFVQDNIPQGDGIMHSQPEAPSQYPLGSRDEAVLDSGDYGPSDEERQRQGRTRDRSPRSTPSQSALDKTSLDNVEEESVESMDGKRSPVLSSPDSVRDARDQSVEIKDAALPGESLLAEASSGMGKDGTTEIELTTNDSNKDGNTQNSSKKQKVISHNEQSVLQELDDGEESKAARSSENSKGRSGSSKEYQKWMDGVEEEVVQEKGARNSGNFRRHLDDNEQNFRRKERDPRQEMERNHMVRKGREGSYPHRDLDVGVVHHLHMRNEGHDRRKEREIPDGVWQRREEDQHSRRSRKEDTRKRERGEEIASRHRDRGNVRESERSDKEELMHSRKHLDNGSYRVLYDKDISARHREREESRHDIVDDYHSKRRKDEEYLRRDHMDKEEIFHGHRETASRRRRERDDIVDPRKRDDLQRRDDIVDPRKRDDLQRIRDNMDDYHAVRHKDEVWIQRERGDRQREREELYKLKQSHEESLSKREKDEGRSSVRTGHGADDKIWIGHARLKDEHRVLDKDYQMKDPVRNSEQRKRREEESYSHHRGRDDVYVRGSQLNKEERKSRQDRSSTRNDRGVDGPENQRVHEKKHKDNTRKNKESEGGDHGTYDPSRRNQEDQSGQTDVMKAAEQRNGEKILIQHSSKRHKDDASSDDEQQDSRRGRSKLERWTSHKERDFSIASKSSASLKFKEIDRKNNSSSSEVTKVPDELPRRAQAAEKLPSVEEEKDLTDTDNKDSDAKPSDDRHLDTVEKLKKRSERFKLPMPSEKDAVTVKKLENEALPSVKTGNPVESEIKPERPARKRRWISG